MTLAESNTASGERAPEVIGAQPGESPSVEAQASRSQRTVTVKDTSATANVASDFVSRLMYSLSCIESTTCGSELVEVTFNPFLLWAARQLEDPMKWAFRILVVLLLGKAALAFHLANLDEDEEPTWARLGLIAGTAWGCVYTTLMLVIYLPIGVLFRSVILHGDIALVFRVPDLDSGNNQFFTCSLTEESNQQNFKLTDSTLLVSELRRLQHSEVTIMLYCERWLKNSNLSRCWMQIFVSIGLVLLETRAGVLGLAVFLFWAWCISYWILPCLKELAKLLWCFFDVLLCCLPGQLLTAAVDSAKARLKERVRSHSAAAAAAP